MLENGKISNRQAKFLLINTVLPTSLVFVPGIIYREALQDSWISVLLVTVFGLLAGLIIAGLGKRFPQKTIIQYSELITGKTLGKITGLSYIIFFIYINTFIIREFGEMLRTAFLTETPVLVFIIGILVTAAYAIRCGLEVLARTNELLLPVVLFMLLIIIILVLPEFQLKLVAPVLEKGIRPALKGTYSVALFFAETVVMLMLIPYLSQPARAGRTILQSIVVIGFFQLAVMLIVIGVVNSLATHLEFPTLVLSRLIKYGKFIENMDPLVLLIWMGGGFVKVSVFYYCTVLATAQWLNLRDYKPLVLPLGVILASLSLMLWDNILELSHQIAAVVPPYMLFMEVGLPLILLSIAVLRGRKENKQ